MIEVNEGHRLHLTALIRQEQDLAYRRHDYLSREWQLSLWREEIKEIMTMHSLRYSPSSVTMTNTTSSCNIVTPDAPSDICVRWREKIIEWKYQVVDRFGKFICLSHIICAAFYIFASAKCSWIYSRTSHTVSFSFSWRRS